MPRILVAKLTLLVALSPALAVAAPAAFAVKLAEGTTVPPPDPKAKHQPPMRTTLLIDEVQGRATRASMALLYVSPKGRVALHRHPGSAKLLYVIEGRGRILAPGMEPGELVPGTAVFVKPGAVHAFDVQSPQKPMKLIEVFAPLGPERVFRDRTKSAGFEVVKGKPTPDPQAFVLVAADDKTPKGPKTIALPGGKAKARLLLDPEVLGAKQGYVGTLELEAGAEVPQHKHDGSAEMLYVLEGAIEVTAGGETLKAEKDTAVFIPEGLPHSGKSAKGARVLQVYAPGGPEQRFKK
jgi:quercetin dioxygenase-like cupin family protein